MRPRVGLGFDDVLSVIMICSFNNVFVWFVCDVTVYVHIALNITLSGIRVSVSVSVRVRFSVSVSKKISRSHLVSFK